VFVISLIIKNMCFLFGGHEYKSRGGRVCTPMYTLTVKLLRRGGPCPTNNGVSYINLVYGLVVTLKSDYYLFILYVSISIIYCMYWYILYVSRIVTCLYWGNDYSVLVYIVC
jgi:hypothetical protein